MSQVERSNNGVAVAVAAGLIAGIAFTGYILKTPAPVAHAAPVAAIDYAAITAAVKAGFPAAPVAAPAVAPAPAPVVKTVYKTVVKRVRAAAPRPAVVRFVVPHYHGCSCAL